MTHAYTVGLDDGKKGVRRGRPNDFEACYEQGWRHGKSSRVASMLRDWDRARENMRKALHENER